MSISPTFIPPLPLPIARSSEQIAQDISASHDSVDLISQLVAADQYSEEIKATVIRNVRHLEQSLTLAHIIDNATIADKTAFADAVDLGDGWMLEIAVQR